MKKLVAKLLAMSGVRAPLGPVPEGVEVNPRYAGNHIVYVLVNMSGETRVVQSQHAMTDVLSGGSTRSITLPKFGVAVLSDKR